MINPINATKTIKGICEFYCVADYVAVDMDKIAVYHVHDDNYHIFRWHLNRYVLAEVADQVNTDNKIRL